MVFERLEVSEAARLLATTIKHWPGEAVSDLERLLAHSLTVRPAAIRREAVLGLLIQIVSGMKGEVPKLEGYDTIRRDRLGNGETWPSGSSLSRAYGTWANAARMAMRCAFGSPRGITTNSKRQALRSQPTRADVLDSIRDCAADIGGRPTQWDYSDWLEVARELDVRAGFGGIARPALTHVRRHFASWDDAIAAALPSFSPEE